jgi:hypothetical protein
MPIATRYPPSRQPYGNVYGGYGLHGHDHCPEQCPYCGPDAGAWAVGSLIVTGVVAVANLLLWAVRHPATVLAMTTIAVAALLVAGNALTPAL